MKILFLTNNEISQQLIRWLRNERKEKVVVSGEKIDPKTLKKIKPDFVISYNYRHLVKKDVISQLGKNIINLHISYLPHNRGSNPNVWSFLDDTPKGVTIHILDEGLDTGDILAQTELEFNENEQTLASSYQKLHQEIQRLFKENWVKISSNKLVPQKQTGRVTSHNMSEFDIIKNDILGLEGWDISIPMLKNRYKKIKNWEKKI